MQGRGLQWRAGSVSPLGSWAPACVPTQCWKHWVGPLCQQPQTCLSSVSAKRVMVLSLGLVAVSFLGGRGAELGILQPWLLGCQWWGPAGIGRMWWLQHLPLPCLHPSHWPREHDQWQNCPFCVSGCAALSQETANCVCWKSITLPQSAPLPCGQGGDILALVSWGSQLTAVGKATPSPP